MSEWSAWLLLTCLVAAGIVFALFLRLLGVKTRLAEVEARVGELAQGLERLEAEAAHRRAAEQTAASLEERCVEARTLLGQLKKESHKLTAITKLDKVVEELEKRSAQAQSLLLQLEEERKLLGYLVQRIGAAQGVLKTLGRARQALGHAPERVVPGDAWAERPADTLASLDQPPGRRKGGWLKGLPRRPKTRQEREIVSAWRTARAQGLSFSSIEELMAWWRASGLDGDVSGEEAASHAQPASARPPRERAGLLPDRPKASAQEDPVEAVVALLRSHPHGLAQEQLKRELRSRCPQSVSEASLLLALHLDPRVRYDAASGIFRLSAAQPDASAREG